MRSTVAHSNRRLSGRNNSRVCFQRAIANLAVVRFQDTFILTFLRLFSLTTVHNKRSDAGLIIVVAVWRDERLWRLCSPPPVRLLARGQAGHCVGAFLQLRERLGAGSSDDSSDGHLRTALLPPFWRHLFLIHIIQFAAALQSLISISDSCSVGCTRGDAGHVLGSGTGRCAFVDPWRPNLKRQFCAGDANTTKTQWCAWSTPTVSSARGRAKSWCRACGRDN